MNPKPEKDYASQIKSLRELAGLTQTELAGRLGVSFVTVNRWENAKSKPSQLSWGQIVQISKEISIPDSISLGEDDQNDAPPRLDFTASADVVRTLVEGERLSFGHQANPSFATETARIETLPHQHIAVYDHMLKQRRLRFLLADDAGAGKTIMTGLYIRQMLTRRAIKRILIVPPAGLVGNWQQELDVLFGLSFNIVSGPSAKNGNPFTGPDSDSVIVSVDTLAGKKMFGLLAEACVEPYELVVFDEAHKLSCDRSPDYRIRKTVRYKLAEAIAGAGNNDQDDCPLTWSAVHLLLLTATPHMGKDYPYFSLWRLLKPDVLTTPEAFEQFPADQRENHFIRRTKEEMIRIDETSIYPTRKSSTLDFHLSQGEVSEQRLYDETTDYLKHVYGRGMPIKSNNAAARLTMGVFQRRLASSTYALLCSFRRRIKKLDKTIRDIESEKISLMHLVSKQKRFQDKDDIFMSKTAYEESSTGMREESQIAEEDALGIVTINTFAELVNEINQVKKLCHLAEQVNKTCGESKFEKLYELIQSEEYANEKFLIFTEHRDTLDFLVNRLRSLGHTDYIASIHGGMHYTERQDQIENFRKPMHESGARFMICTDAAAEGVNLQFCWIMFNYDIPWNPARLEQRMGRIHRYGQKHDPVIIFNLVSLDTREGKVLKTLLVKLEKIRKQMNSGKVFDSIGRIFRDVCIRNYMEKIVNGDDADIIAGEIERELTVEKVEGIQVGERCIYGEGDDILKEIPRLRELHEREVYRRLMPGYMNNFICTSAPLVGLRIDGDINGQFNLLPASSDGTDPFHGVLDGPTLKESPRTFVLRRDDIRRSIWMHPGSKAFEQLHEFINLKLSRKALHGAVFLDPKAKHPYLFHLARLSIVRKADPDFAKLKCEEVVDYQLMGIKQTEDSDISICPPEHLLLLRSGRGLPPMVQKMALNAGVLCEKAQAYIGEQHRILVEDCRTKLTATLGAREAEILQGDSFWEADLATARAKMVKKTREGDTDAESELRHIKAQQQDLHLKTKEAVAAIHREPSLIMPGEMTFIAHALVVPSDEPADLEWRENNVERISMEFVRAFEEAAGAKVRYVHTPELARDAALTSYPGFDILSERPSKEVRHIEVKGRTGEGEVQLSRNEWGRAANLGKSCWLYVVYHCEKPFPKLWRVQDPFGNLVMKNFDGSGEGVRFKHSEIVSVGQS